MDKNLSLIAKELFGKIRTQFPKIKLGDENSKVTDDPEKARFFEFNFVNDGEDLGRITVSISSKDEDGDGDVDGLVVIYGNNVIADQDDLVRQKFFSFLKELREFARQRLLNFDTRDISKSNLEKRDYQHLAKKNTGEGNMTESKLYGTSMTSYQQLGETKLIVKHHTPVNVENPAGRTQRIESIYIENSQGERFKYPYTHLNGARALAQHVSHGGTPYDTIGEHVISLSEELSQLRKFKHYVERNDMVSEAMGGIQSKVMERIDAVKKQIHTLQSPSRYEEFAESFTATESKEIPEDILNDWVDRLTIRTFNEELKTVFPYIFKLVDESDIPVKNLTIEDIMSEKTLPWETDDEAKEREAGKKDKSPFKKPHNPNRTGKDAAKALAQKGIPKSEGLDMFAAFESQVDKILGEGADIFSDDEQAADAAIERLNQLVANPFPVGTDGNNAIESLTDIIDDEELMQVFKELADINPESDARDILKDYIEIKDQEHGSDVMSKVTFPEGDATEVPAEPAPSEEPPAEPLATEPAPEAPAAAGAPAPVPPPAAESIIRAIGKAQRAGATMETRIRLGGKEMSLGEAVRQAGLTVEDVFKGKHNEVIEYVKSMFDDTTGQFPKGEMGVKIAVEKKFGEETGPIAEKIMGKLQSVSEMSRMKKLAGM